MVFDVKQNLWKKSQLISGGRLFDMMEIPVYSFKINNISVNLLHMISYKSDMKQLCGNFGNDFSNAYTNKEILERCFFKDQD